MSLRVAPCWSMRLARVCRNRCAAKQMCGDLLWSIYSRLCHRAASNMADTRRASQWHTGSVCAQEDPLCRPSAPVQTQIASKSGSYPARQWKKILSASFASDKDLTFPPTNVSQFQCDDLTGPESQSCQTAVGLLNHGGPWQWFGQAHPRLDQPPPASAFWERLASSTGAPAELLLLDRG